MNIVTKIYWTRSLINAILINFFQLQVSEVITRTRQYMMELVGGQGNVMTHHKTIKDLEQYYSSMGDNKDVKEFLKNITSDKEG